MGQSNRVRRAYCMESSLGTLPGSPTFKILRSTGGSFSAPPTTKRSAEIRSDRQRGPMVRVGQQTDGRIEAELSYGSYDDLLEAALCGAWSTAINFSGSVQVTASTRTVQATGAFTDAVVGQWVVIAGMTNAANNRFAQIATRVGANEVTMVDDGVAWADETDPSATIKSSGMLRNGTTERSAGVEIAHLDFDDYVLYSGMRVGGFTLNAAVENILTISFDFLGQSAQTSGTTFSTGGTPTAANSNAVYNATEDIGAVLYDSQAPAETIESIEINYSNNLRTRKGLGSQFPEAVPYGSVDVTGSVRLYPEDKSWMDIFLAGTKGKWSFRVTDAAGNSYIFTVYRAGQADNWMPDLGGLDGDVMQTLGWAAEPDSSLTSVTFQIDRFAAA